MNCPSEGLCRSVNCLEIKWWTAQWTVRKYFSFLILRTNWYPIWWSQFMKPKTETCTGYVINMELTWGNEAVWKRRKKTFLQAQSVLKTTAYFYSDLTFLKMFQLVKFYRVFFFFWPHLEAWELSVPQSEIKPRPLVARVLSPTNEPPKWSEVAQSCPTLCNPVDCSLPGSSVRGILQARILEWVTISFSRGSSWPSDQTRVSRIGGRRFNLWATRRASPNSIIYTSSKQNCKI